MADGTLEEQINEFLENKETELRHSGVPGMKWGHRKGGGAVSRSEKKAAKAQNNLDIMKARQKVGEKANFGKKLLNASTYGRVGSKPLIFLMNKHSGAKLSDVRKAGEHTSGEKAGLRTVLGIAGGITVASLMVGRV